MAGYFIHYIFFHDENCNEKVTVYGNGQTKGKSFDYLIYQVN